MAEWLKVFIIVFASYGIYSAVRDIVILLFGNKKEEIYIYLTPERVFDGKWDMVISSEDEDRILNALSGEYKKIYILRGGNKWTENTSKEEWKK